MSKIKKTKKKEHKYTHNKPLHLGPIVIKNSNLNLHNKDYSKGVFASEDLDFNVLIEESPLLLIEESNLDGILVDYVFLKNNNYWLVLGYASIYNHSDNPNCKIILHTEKKIAHIVTLRKIKKGEELFFNYGGLYWQNKKAPK